MIKSVLWEYSCIEEYTEEFYKGEILRWSLYITSSTSTKQTWSYSLSHLTHKLIIYHHFKSRTFRKQLLFAPFYECPWKCSNIRPTTSQAFYNHNFFCETRLITDIAENWENKEEGIEYIKLYTFKSSHSVRSTWIEYMWDHVDFTIGFLETTLKLTIDWSYCLSKALFFVRI